MGNIQELSDQLSYLWSRRRTFKGLITLFISSNVFFFTIVIPACHLVLTKTCVVSTPKSYGYFFSVVALICGVLNLLLFSAWTYWRTIPISRDGKLTILFAPTSDTETSSLVNKIYGRLCDDISAKGLSNLIECRQLPENHVIRTNEDAHDILRRSGSRLAIYGSYSKGKLNDEIIEGFRSITFTVIHRSLNPHEAPSIANYVASALEARQFAISDKNSFIEQDVVINNLSEVSRFFIGLALTLDSKIKDAQGILEPLLGEVEGKAMAKANNPQLEKFANAIRRCLTVIYDALFANSYHSGLIENVTDRAYDSVADECRQHLNKLARINVKNSSYFLSEAILFFHFGDVDAAIKSVEHARRLSSPRNAPHRFSLAFLYLWKRDYRKSFMQYMRASKWSNPDMVVITSVLMFLATIRKLHPARTDVLFAQAFVNDRFFDQHIALEDYRAFLQSTLSKDHLEFTAYANRRVKELESTNKAVRSETTSAV